MKRRVVVTGAGLVTALGCELADFWDRICAGKSGVGPLKRFDTTDFKVTFGGEIRDFSPEDHLALDGKEIRRLDRFVQFAMVAAHKAIEHSGIDLSQGDSYRLRHADRQRHRRPARNRGTALEAVRTRPVARLPIHDSQADRQRGQRQRLDPLALRGPNSAVATACATATNAIGDAYRLIQNDMADVMFAGGSEAAITPMGLSGFARMNALSTRNQDPEKASRPFDSERDGFVLSEGAGVLVLEEFEHAKSRGATLLAEILGYGMTADATHMTAPDPEGRGAARAMSCAFKRRPHRSRINRLH